MRGSRSQSTKEHDLPVIQVKAGNKASEIMCPGGIVGIIQPKTGCTLTQGLLASVSFRKPSRGETSSCLHLLCEHGIILLYSEFTVSSQHRHPLTACNPCWLETHIPLYLLLCLFNQDNNNNKTSYCFIFFIVDVFNLYYSVS